MLEGNVDVEDDIPDLPEMIEASLGSFSVVDREVKGVEDEELLPSTIA